MAARKAAASKKQTERSEDVKGSRPNIPGYGIPTTKTGLLAWSHVETRMAQAMHYWVATVGPAGQPHATPVDGLWLDGRLYFGGAPTTRRNRNLAANPNVCIHLDSGSDVVIMHGQAPELNEPTRDLLLKLVQASKEKYGYAPSPESYSGGGVFVFRPRVVFAWASFPKDVTRWTLEEDEAART